MDVVSYEGLASAMLTDGVAVGGALEGLVCDLFKADITPDANTPLATLTAGIADYSGYAQGTVTLSALTRADDGSLEILCQFSEFRPNATTVTNTVFGYFVRDAGGTLIAAGRFDNGPLNMASALDSIRITHRQRVQTPALASVVS